MRRPGEFQRPLRSAAPWPSKILWRRSAMRYARRGPLSSAPLNREAMEDFVQDVFDLARPKFGQGSLENLREALELHFEPPHATRPSTVRTIEVEVGAA